MPRARARWIEVGDRMLARVVGSHLSRRQAVNRFAKIARCLAWSIVVLKYDGKSRPVYTVRRWHKRASLRFITTTSQGRVWL